MGKELTLNIFSTADQQSTTVNSFPSWAKDMYFHNSMHHQLTF